MKRIALIFTCFLINVFCIFSQENKITKVFVLAGQSNMEGAADALDLTEVDLEDLKIAQKNILLAYNGSKPKPLHVTIPEDWKKKKIQA